jgi:hypothetical protein
VPYILDDPPELEGLAGRVDPPPRIVVLVEEWYLTT